MKDLMLLAVLIPAFLATGCSGDAQSAPASVAATQPEERQFFQSIEDSAVRRDVPYVPTPQATVDEMLRLAKVSKGDLVYDLGSGDGRIVITAAKNHGARGVGIDIDPVRIEEANENARKARVTDRVRFIRGDLFEADFRDADAVTLYLLRSVNLRLRPKLLADLRPGTPVVSHDFDMGEWEPEEHKRVGDDDVYLWIIPAQINGRWQWTGADGRARSAEVKQEFQNFTGTVRSGNDTFEISNGKIRGEEVSFDVTRNGTVVERYRGRFANGTLHGKVQAGNRSSQWRATHE